MPKSKTPTFEEAFNELATTVQKLETGELSLEGSLDLYERGMALATQLEQLLAQAELRIRKVQPHNTNVEDTTETEA